MVSNERRRYDAQKLREEGFAECLGDDHGIIDSPEDAGELMLRVLDVICDYRDGMHYYPNFFEGKAVTELLAELIDRPTCRNVADPYDGGRFECSNCGEVWEVTCGNPADNNLNYCPRCGAEVVE